MKKNILLLLLIFIPLNSYSQNLEYRSVEYYFDLVKKAEIEELKKEGLLTDTLQIVEKYKENGKESFNKNGIEKYYEIKIKVLQSFFKDYLFQQYVEFNDDVYVLYFSMAGFDDIEWQILKWKKQDWDRSDQINVKSVEDCKSDSKKTNGCNFTPIAFNYDEGPKNSNNVRIFIKNGFLVMERGGLFHTLYDLKNQKLLINEESPWAKSKAKDKEELNKWIKENLHDKIKKIINR